MNTSETPSDLFHLITANLSKHLSNFISNISLRQLAVEHYRTIEGQQVEGRALTIFILSIALHFGAWSVKQICKLKLNILINFSEDWEIFHVKTWLRLSPPLLFWWITKYKLKIWSVPKTCSSNVAERAMTKIALTCWVLSSSWRLPAPQLGGITH